MAGNAGTMIARCGRSPFRCPRAGAVAAEDLEGWLRERITQIRQGREPLGCYHDIPGCPPAELAAFAARVRQELGAELPTEYLSFLSVRNGGGERAELYGTRTSRFRSTDGSEAHVTGFLDENHRLRLGRSPFNALLVYGETDLDYIVQDLNTGRFRLRSKMGGEHSEEFPDMVTVIKFAMA